MSDYQEMVAETETRRVYITPDEREESPRMEWDHFGIMACRHRHYLLGDYKHDMTREVWDAYDRCGNLAIVARWLRMFHGATVVLPLGLYDHSGISMYVGSGAHPFDSGGWDSGVVGLIFDTPEQRETWGFTGDDWGTPERIEEALRGEVKEYDQYLTGDVWGYVVERRETWTNGSGETMATWEHEDSLWGLYGSEYAKQEALAAFEE